MSSFTPDVTSLTPDESYALFAALVPPITGSPAGEWAERSDMELEYAQPIVCATPVPLPVGGDRAARDELENDVAPGLMTYDSSCLLGAYGTESFGRSATLTTLVFDDARLATEALAYAAEVVDGARAGTTERVERRPDLAPVRESPNVGSLAFSVVAKDEADAQMVFMVRFGPVLVLVEGDALDLPAATSQAEGLWSFAAERLRAVGLLRD